MPHIMPRRTALFGLAAGATTFATTRVVSAADTVQIALPTKTYFPTIITEAAVRQKLFEKEGIVAEPTVYRGGAECLEAMAAGAADISLGGPPVVGVAIKKGVGMKLIATSSTGYLGWYLLVKADSPVTKVQDLAGKKVGITSAGSGSDFLALWTNEQYKTPFTRVPLGGGGLVPNLRGGNVDAVVLYSPLSFEMMQAKQARMLIDYSAEVPANLAGGWVVTQKLLDEKPAVVQKALNALYGGLNWLRNNHDAAVALIVEVDEIKPAIAEMEYTQTIMKLATDATLKPEEIQRALDMGKLIGITDTAPIGQSVHYEVCTRPHHMTNRFAILLVRLALLAAVLLVWEMLPRLGLVEDDLLPPFSEVASVLFKLFGRPQFQVDMATTALEIVTAFAVAVPLGALFGLLVAESPYAARVFDPLLFFLFSIPKSIFLPMFILTLGIGFWQKVGFGCFSTTLLVLLSTQAAVRSVRPDHLLVARSYGATPLQVIARVYLPSMLPIVLEALRLALIFTFTAVTLAEMYASRTGIGHQIETWGENFMMPQLLAGVLLMSITAIVLNEGIRWLEHRCGVWRT